MRVRECGELLLYIGSGDYVYIYILHASSPFDVSRLVHPPATGHEGVDHVGLVVEVLRPCLLVLDHLHSSDGAYQDNMRGTSQRRCMLTGEVG